MYNPVANYFKVNDVNFVVRFTVSLDKMFHLTDHVKQSWHFKCWKGLKIDRWH